MIDLNDLRHSINRALNLGRYTVRVAVVGGEQVPSSIDLDLLERDDDLWGAIEDSNRQSIESVMARIHEALDAEDDHGPTVPAQDFCWDLSNAKPYDGPKFEPIGQRPRIYEFSLGDITRGPLHEDLSLVELGDAPDLEAATRADWVHVFDRVTRERRTLKRPEPDVVLKGLNDVAADLRGRGGRVTADYANTERGEEVFTAPKRGDPVEPPFGCYTPPVGPLTSTDGLKAGDVLRVADGEDWYDDKLVSVLADQMEASRFDKVRVQGKPSMPALIGIKSLAFVARPGVWMPWSGGENPVGELTVLVEFNDREQLKAQGHILEPFWPNAGGAMTITRYMVIDTPPASSDT